MRWRRPGGGYRAENLAAGSDSVQDVMRAGRPLPVTTSICSCHKRGWSTLQEWTAPETPPWFAGLFAPIWRNVTAGTPMSRTHSWRQPNKEPDMIAGIRISRLPYALFFVVRQRGVTGLADDPWQQCFRIGLGRMFRRYDCMTLGI